MKNKILFTIISVFISMLGFAQTVSQVDTIPVKQKIDSGTVFTFAEVMPEFPVKGGFNNYLRSNIKYPVDEFKKRIQGTVYVKFVVEKDGSITNVKIVKEVQGALGFSAEAMRVIAMMPKWTPGTVGGKLVRVEITQPIRFLL